jgi:deoxyribonuclease IV
MRLGFHLSIAGSLNRALDQARSLGCEALQIFVQNPRAWKWRDLPAAELDRFIAARRQSGLWPLVVHLTYLPNLAAADPRLHQLSRGRLYRELALARDLEADYLVVHPGHGPLGEETFRRVAATLVWAISRVPPPPLVLLENTAGQGLEIGYRPAHMRQLIDFSGVPLGLCLDTAHAFGAGYDLRVAAGVDRLLADIAQGPGLERLKMLHLNDSRAVLASRVDRHWHLGLGAIGFEGLRQFLRHPWLTPDVAIMETPKKHPADDWCNLLVARGLVKGVPLLP